MTDNVIKLLDSICNQVSGDYEKKIEKMKIIATPLIEDGDLTIVDLDTYILLNKIKNDILISHLLNNIKDIDNTIKLLNSYFSKFLTEEETYIYFNIIKEYVIPSTYEDIFDLTIMKMFSTSSNKSVATPSLLKLIKIKRDENKFLFTKKKAYSKQAKVNNGIKINSVNNGCSGGSYYSSC